MPVPLRQLNDTILSALKQWKSYFSANSTAGSTAIATFLTRNLTKIGKKAYVDETENSSPIGFGLRSLTTEIDHPDQANLNPGLVYHETLNGGALSVAEAKLFRSGDDDKFEYNFIEFDSQDEPPVAGTVAKGMKPVNADNFTKTEKFVYWYRLEDQFGGRGRNSKTSGNGCPAYLNRVVYSGSPEDIEDLIYYAEDKVNTSQLEGTEVRLQFADRNDFAKKVATNVSQLKPLS